MKYRRDGIFTNNRLIWPVLVLLITLLGAVLRFHRLGELPAILNRDEAALAYNAVLLKETGLDEWQRSWPLALESFGDFKLIGYPAALTGVFSLVPPGDWAARLPSALAGTTLVILIYLLGRRFQLSKPYALVWSLTVAISPIFFFYSRIAFEANVALALTVASLVAMLWSASSPTRHLLDVTAAGLWLLAILTYNAPLILTPFLIVAIALVRGIARPQTWAVPVGLLGLVAGGMYVALQPVTAQKQAVTLWGDETIHLQWASFRSNLPGILKPLIGRKTVFVTPKIIDNFFAYFSPGFIVTQGGRHPWHSLPGSGHLYWVSYGLGVVTAGAVAVKAALTSVRLARLRQVGQNLKQRLTQPQDVKWLWAVMTIAATAPGIITVDAPHATRSLLFFVLLSGWGVYGLQQAAGWLDESLLDKKSLLKHLPSKHGLATPPRPEGRMTATNLAVPALSLAMTVSSVGYLQAYFQGFIDTHPASLKQGFSQVIRRVDGRYPDQAVAVVDDEGFQYILTAWYLQTSADTFFKSIIKQQPDPIGFRYGEQLDRYHFIAQAADRSPQERILVEWTGREWLVTEF